MPYDELTYKHLSRLAEKIRQRIPRNTGGASESLEIRGNQLLGNDYIFYLDQGRGPGKFPPVQNIRDWVRSQLGISDEKENRQVAFLIGRAIAEGKKTPPEHSGGTEIYRDKSKGIRLDDLVEETLNELEKELPGTVAAEALKWL